MPTQLMRAAVVLFLFATCGAPREAVEPRREVCDNGADDNADHKTDCADPECFGAPPCQLGGAGGGFEEGPAAPPDAGRQARDAGKGPGLVGGPVPVVEVDAGVTIDAGEPPDAGAIDAGPVVIAGFTPGPAGCQPQQLEADVSVGGYRSDRYGWSDTGCQRRTAALVRNNAADPGGSRGGYLRELTFSANGSTRTARGTGSNGWHGWGYVVNHYNGGAADTSKGKTGTFRTVLAGAHHAIHEFKVQMNPGGPLSATVHWFFATGRTAPVYAITFDASAAGPNALSADTRSPYGDFAFEGAAGPIAGIGWGDKFRFTTTGNGPVTANTGWDYTQPNLVPYVRMWSSGVDAEMGAVQTQTFDQRVAGGDYGNGVLGSACQGRTSANRGAGCSTGGETMPINWLWPYQLNQWELPFTNASHRLAWGASYGAIGQSSISAFGKTFSGYPTMRYGVFLVVGAHSTNDTLAQVAQVERMTAATVTGAVWNPMYAAWDAAGTTVTLDPKGSEIVSPVFHFSATTALSQVRVNGSLLAANAGYFATLDPATQSLWLTLNGKVSGPVSIQIQ